MDLRSSMRRGCAALIPIAFATWAVPSYGFAQTEKPGIFYSNSVLVICSPTVLSSEMPGFVGDTTHLHIRVTDQDGEPVPEAKVQVWGSPLENALLQPQRDRKLEASHWSLTNPTETDMSGEAIVKVAELKTLKLCITARLGGKLAGFVEIPGASFDLSDTCEIKLQPTKQLTAFVIDYDTGSPIEGAKVEVWMNSYQGIRVDTGINFVTESDGKMQLDGLIPGMNARIKATCNGYHNFVGRAPSVDYGLRESNRVETPPTLELIRESSYQRALESARLLIPDVSNMADVEALDTLVRNYERTKKRTKRMESGKLAFSIGQANGYMDYMRRLPSGLYRNMVWELAQDTEDEEVRLEAYLWLLKTNEHGRVYVKSVENEQVVSQLVERFTTHQRMGEALLIIRSIHPKPQTALESILRENPDRQVQAQALKQLIYSVSTSYHSLPRSVVIPDDIEMRQLNEMRYLNRLAEQYGDLPGTSRNETLKDFAVRRLDWLDKYGIGGSPPDLTGENLNGKKKASLSDFPGKVVVLHFWSTYQIPEFNDLKSIADRHKTAVQVLGVAYGNRKSAENLLKKHPTSWPILWDSHQGMVTRRGATYLDSSGLMWGNHKVNNFKWFSTFVIDSSGTIRTAGLTGDKLQSFVSDLVDSESD